MKLLSCLLLLLFGLISGGCIGFAVISLTGGEGGSAARAHTAGREFVKLNSPFVVPILQEERVIALAVLSLGLETEGLDIATVHAQEPRLRDAFLKVLFAHANTGGFQGNFTEAGALEALRKALTEEGRLSLGEGLVQVLITEINRRDAG